MPEAKKTNTLIEKTILFQKNIWIHMKKGHRTVFQNAWSQKKQTVSLKKQFRSKKTPKIHMKKGFRTVFQNTWNQKNNTLTETTILFQKSF